MTSYANPRWPWLVCIILMLATFLSYLDRNSFGVVAPKIQEEFLLMASIISYKVINL